MEYEDLLKLFLKSVVSILLVVVLLVGLGITGAYFYIWPTNFNDQSLNVTEITQRELANLIEEKKFYPEPSAFYFGAPNENIRSKAEIKVNFALNAIVEVVKANPKNRLFCLLLRVRLKISKILIPKKMKGRCTILKNHLKY
jgi:hypothetical protein